jgi:alkaline phosphatase D
MREGEPSGVFAHAAASFDPTSSSVLLWTRLSGGRTEADWVVSTDPGLSDVVASGSATTGPGQDHTITVDVEGLAPTTTYWYGFHVDGESSPVGRTRTLPGGDTGRFVLATVCCSHYAVAPLGVYRAVADREFDLVLHLGDYIYEDDGSHAARRHDPPRVAVTLEDYRRRMAQVRRDPDAQALHLRHPMVGIWDDHDLSDNAWHDGAKHHDPREHGPWGARVAGAARARQEWFPARLRDPSDPTVTWRSVLVGDLAELVLLDTRYAGRDRQAGDDESADLHDPDRSLLGEPQRTWLRERLADRERPWAVLASGVVVNELELSWPRPLRWVNHFLPNGYAVLDGRVLHDDQWDGYPAERERVTAWLRSRGECGGRTVILSGDVHSSWAFVGPCDPTSGDAVAVEATTPAVSSAAMGRAHYPGMWWVLDRAANRLDHVRWADVTERGFGVLELTADAATMSWWFVHPYDTDPAARAAPAAAFRSERAAWPPRFERVDVPPLLSRDTPVPPLPPRPPDLARLRRRSRLRLTAESAGIAAILALPLVLWRRSRN